MSDPTPYPPSYGTAPASGATPPAASSPLATTSVVLGGVPLALGLAQPFLQAAAIQGDLYEVIGVVGVVQAVLSLLLGVAAIVTGAIALNRRESRRALAGVGIGLGVAATAGAVVAGLFPLVFSLLSAF